MTEKYYFNNEKSPFAKITESEIETFQNAYEGEEYSTMDTLKKAFPDYPTTNIFKSLPYRLTDEKCPNCGGNVYHKFRRQSSKREEHKICVDCQHTFLYDCDCEQCRNKKISDQKEKWNNYMKVYYPKYVQVENLSYYNEIHIIKIIDLYYNRDSDCIIFPQPRNRYSFYQNQSQFSDYVWEILVSLVNTKIIKPAVGGEYGYNNYPPYTETLNLSDYQWTLNLSHKGQDFSIKDFIDLAKNRKFTSEVQLEIFKDIYRSEVRNYTNFYSEKFLKFEIDEFIVDLITECFFDHYSLSKVFSNIYYALNASLRFQASYKASPKKVMGHFRNKIVEYSHNLRDPKSIKDFNRLPDENIGEMNDYSAKYIGLPYNWFYLDAKMLFPELVILDELVENTTDISLL